MLSEEISDMKRWKISSSQKFKLRTWQIHSISLISEAFMTESGFGGASCQELSFSTLQSAILTSKSQKLVFEWTPDLMLPALQRFKPSLIWAWTPSTWYMQTQSNRSAISSWHSSIDWRRWPSTPSRSCARSIRCFQKQNVWSELLQKSSTVLPCTNWAASSELS